MKSTLTFICFLTVFYISSYTSLLSQEPQKYYPVTDPLVKEKLEQWQDLKFGLLMHWGAYSQWGVVESWSLCPEDYGWCERKKGKNPENYFEYKKEYENLISTFNPVKFDPEKWAEAAKKAGMQYVVFTTKHHDGFTMFDSKYTDYKITGKDCPFNSNQRSNVTNEIFNAFRNEGFWIGAYYSKPDWHNEYYWDPYFPPLDRNVNYDPKLYPEKWNKFVEFTHDQIMELMTDYGKVDILWLDGGWVCTKSKEELKDYYDTRLKEGTSGFIKNRVVSQDIKMDDLVKKARSKQPGLIVVDRAVEGINQNYLTPENRIPETPLPFPWESCIIGGGSWSWIPDAKYLTGREVVHMLIDIVAKGGNLLLNIAPSPLGEFDEGAYKMLSEVSQWMIYNNECIYNTRSVNPFSQGDKIYFTQSKDVNVLYVIYLLDKEISAAEIDISINELEINPKSISLLGFDKEISWTMNDEGFKITVPEKLPDPYYKSYAWVFKIDKK